MSQAPPNLPFVCLLLIDIKANVIIHSLTVQLRQRKQFLSAALKTTPPVKYTFSKDIPEKKKKI